MGAPGKSGHNDPNSQREVGHNDTSGDHSTLFNCLRPLIIRLTLAAPAFFNLPLCLAAVFAIALTGISTVLFTPKVHKRSNQC